MEEFSRKNLEKRKKEITEALSSIIEKIKSGIEELKNKTKIINYDCGDDFDIRIPTIPNFRVEDQLKNEFDKEKESKLKEKLEAIEQKRLIGFEKVLFGDAKEQQQIIKELREMKIGI